MSEEHDVNEWFRLAEMDWQTATHLYKNMYPKPREIICFLCQQAIEKLLKGILMNCGLPIMKTHDLTAIVESLPNNVQFPAEYKPTCATLSIYAVKIRYPHELNLEEFHVDKAIEETNKLYVWLSEYIHQKGGYP